MCFGMEDLENSKRCSTKGNALSQYNSNADKTSWSDENVSKKFLKTSHSSPEEGLFNAKSLCSKARSLSLD